MAFRVFVRDWWKPNPAWPNGREPGAGPRHVIRARVETEAEAHALARRYNETHDPGPLSRKAEYESL
jgi:hypothetical protein